MTWTEVLTTDISVYRPIYSSHSFIRNGHT